MSFGGELHYKPYIEQFERIKRWHAVLNKFKFSNASESETNQQVDYIYAFFINCYHIKDWLIHSRSDIKVKVDSFIENNEEMKICRDICNKCKHLSLTNPSINEFNGFVQGVCLLREYDPFQQILKNNNPVKNQKYIVLVRDKKFDVFELADQCVCLWENFLKENNIM